MSTRRHLHTACGNMPSTTSNDTRSTAKKPSATSLSASELSIQEQKSRPSRQGSKLRSRKCVAPTAAVAVTESNSNKIGAPMQSLQTTCTSIENTKKLREKQQNDVTEVIKARDKGIKQLPSSVRLKSNNVGSSNLTRSKKDINLPVKSSHMSSDQLKIKGSLNGSIGNLTKAKGKATVDHIDCDDKQSVQFKSPGRVQPLCDDETRVDADDMDDSPVSFDAGSEESFLNLSQDGDYESEVRWDCRSQETIRSVMKMRGQYSVEGVREIVANFSDAHVQPAPENSFKLMGALHPHRSTSPSVLSPQNMIFGGKTRASKKRVERLQSRSDVEDMINLLRGMIQKKETAKEEEKSSSNSQGGTSVGVSLSKSSEDVNSGASGKDAGTEPAQDEDIWSDDDLFQDNSFLLELTQNPEKYCQTQLDKAATLKRDGSDNTLSSAVLVPRSGCETVTPCTISTSITVSSMSLATSSTKTTSAASAASRTSAVGDSFTKTSSSLSFGARTSLSVTNSFTRTSSAAVSSTRTPSVASSCIRPALGASSFTRTSSVAGSFTRPSSITSSSSKTPSLVSCNSRSSSVVSASMKQSSNLSAGNSRPTNLNESSVIPSSYVKDASHSHKLLANAGVASAKMPSAKLQFQINVSNRTNIQLNSNTKSSSVMKNSAPVIQNSMSAVSTSHTNGMFPRQPNGIQHRFRDSGYNSKFNNSIHQFVNGESASCDTSAQTAKLKSSNQSQFKFQKVSGQSQSLKHPGFNNERSGPGSNPSFRKSLSFDHGSNGSGHSAGQLQSRGSDSAGKGPVLNRPRSGSFGKLNSGPSSVCSAGTTQSKLFGVSSKHPTTSASGDPTTMLSKAAGSCVGAGGKGAASKTDTSNLLNKDNEFLDLSLPDEILLQLIEPDEILDSQMDTIPSSVKPEPANSGSNIYLHGGQLQKPTTRSDMVKNLNSHPVLCSTSLNRGGLGEPLLSPVRPQRQQLQSAAKIGIGSPMQAFFKKTFGPNHSPSSFRGGKHGSPSGPSSSTPVKLAKTGETVSHGDSTAQNASDSLADVLFDDSFMNDEALFESQILPMLEKAECEAFGDDAAPACPQTSDAAGFTASPPAVQCSPEQIEQKRLAALQRRSERLSQRTTTGLRR